MFKVLNGECKGKASITFGISAQVTLQMQAVVRKGAEVAGGLLGHYYDIATAFALQGSFSSSFSFGGEYDCTFNLAEAVPEFKVPIYVAPIPVPIVTPLYKTYPELTVKFEAKIKFPIGSKKTSPFIMFGM